MYQFNEIFLIGEERFQGGTLVGIYNGIATDGELISIEASGISPEGRYVLLQKDNHGLDEDDWMLHIADFAVFGEYIEAQISGYTNLYNSQSEIL